MLWTILVILVVMWALGLGIGIAGNLIHLLLVVAPSSWLSIFFKGVESDSTHAVVRKYLGFADRGKSTIMR